MNKTIYSKTARGMREAADKTKDLSRDLRRVLKAIDGKSDVAALLRALDGYSEKTLAQAIGTLVANDFIRALESADAPTASRSASPTPAKSVAPPPSAADQGEELDFTAWSSPPADTASEVAEKAKAEAEAKLKAEIEAKAIADAAAKAKAQAEVEAAAKHKAAEEQVRREAEEKARREAEAKLKAETEAKVRAEAEAKAKAEAEEKARREAEAKAKAQAEAAAVAQRKAAEEQARREAEEKARREAEEAKARAEAERLRLAAENERLRQEAERLRLEAEQKVKAAAEQARQEAEAKARRETEARLRAEAEAKAEAAAAAQRKATEEQARREAEEAKARAEAEARARKEAEERARREAEEAKARAEAEAREKQEAAVRAQREAEEARLREEAMRLRIEAECKEKAAAEEKARQAEEARVRAEAERKEQEAAAAKAHEKAAAQARREAEEQARREAEAARAHAEAEAERQRLEAERRARQAAEEQQRLEEIALEAERRAQSLMIDQAGSATVSAGMSAGGASGVRRDKRNATRNYLRIAMIVVVVALAILHVVPFDGRLAALEQAASAQFGQPVKAAGAHFWLFPPQWRIKEVRIGDKAQVRVALVKASTSPLALFGDAPIGALQLETVQLDGEGLAWILLGRTQAKGLGFTRVAAHDVQLRSSFGGVPPFDAEATLDANGRWQSIKLTTAERKFGAELTTAGDGAEIKLDAAMYQLPLTLTAEAPPPGSPVLKNFNASGRLSAQGFDIAEFSGETHDGYLSGKARLSWATGWSLTGEVAAKALDTVALVPGMADGGLLGGKANFTMQSATPDALMSTLTLDGDFVVERGALKGVDLSRVLRGVGSGSRTPYDSLSGQFVYRDGKTQLSNVVMDAGQLTARGNAEAMADKRLSGRFEVQLKSPSMTARSGMTITGTLDNPRFGN